MLKLVEEKKASRDFNAEKLYHGVAAVTKMANNIALMKVNIWGKELLNRYPNLNNAFWVEADFEGK